MEVTAITPTKCDLSVRSAVRKRMWVNQMRAESQCVEKDSGVAPRTPTWRRYRRWSHRRPYGLAILVAAAAIGLTACGGSPNSPHVANLGTSTTMGGGHAGANTTTVPKGGNATQLMDEWATCMRANGDPNQTDPTIDQYGVINITIPQGVTDTSISSEAHGS